MRSFKTTGNTVSKYRGAPGCAFRVVMELCSTSGSRVPDGTTRVSPDLDAALSVAFSDPAVGAAADSDAGGAVCAAGTLPRSAVELARGASGPAASCADSGAASSTPAHTTRIAAN